MSKGTIRELRNDRGFITTARGGRLYFHQSCLATGTRFGDLRVGAAVEYEAEQESDGRWRAVNVRLLESSAAISQSSQYRFLNPYNFVRFLSPPEQKVADRPTTALAAAFHTAGLTSAGSQEQMPELHLLGRCAPPPHDRYLGITGKITCTLKVETPLFVSNSEGIETHGEHKSYEFFKLDGDPALPATSLRGMLRSVFEAVTNSCISTLAGGVRLSYHLPPADALKLVPARAEEGEDGNWSLRLLPGTTPLRAGRKPDGPQYAAWVLRYQPLRASQNMSGNSPYSKRTKLELNGYRHKMGCWALMKLMRHPRRNFEFWNVERLEKESQQLTTLNLDERVVEGYLCITNQNIENKHDERFFFYGGGLENAPRIPLPKSVRDDYTILIRDYQQRHRDRVQRRRKSGDPERSEGKSPAFSRFIVDKNAAELRDGDLVYASLKNANEVDFIVPVSVPRVAYQHSIADLLPDKAMPDEWKYVTACTRSESLCPTCRVFGWVHQNAPEEAARVAYAGRVRISHGRLVSKDKVTKLSPVPLAILSSPKPTTTRFYLMPKSGSVPERWSEGADDGYGYGNTLRGRKFYRHQGTAQEEEYGRAGGRCDDQNRTVRDALAPGAEFEFTIHFENLAPVELGALLWTLEMDNRGFHRLGFAKPLGFGSVAIRINSLKVLDPARRYASLDDDGWLVVRDGKERSVQIFKTAMAKRYGFADFESMPNVQDLRVLLGNPANGLPIHYPRTARRTDPEGKNFEWFMGNNRYQKYALAPAIEDKGLPLISRDGSEVK